MTIKMRINNAPLLPEYVPDDQVTVDENGTPDWAAGLIFAQIRITTATKEGTLQSAVKVLDHYAEMGVNALWVCPIYDTEADDRYGNAYGNAGPHTVNPVLTGTEDYAKGWLEVKAFVDEAHKRNIRILFDIIMWGTRKTAPLRKEHPDWYNGEEAWGGYAFDWTNSELREWFIERAVDIVNITGCDGLRYDLEPGITGYDIAKEIRRRLNAQGKKPFMMSEQQNERNDAYDVDEIGIIGLEEIVASFYKKEPEYFFLDEYDIVDTVKQGRQIGGGFWKEKNLGCAFRYYMGTVACHDNRFPVLCGNRLAIGYQSIFSPFIPMWYIGEEWNNPQTVEDVLYFNTIDWAALDQPENRAFYEDVKKMLRIRRSYPEILTYYPEHFRDTNICKVVTSAKDGPCAYARYADGKALLIVPNAAKERTEITVTVPFAAAGLDSGREYQVTDAETGETVASGIHCGNDTFTVTVSHMDQKVLLTEPSE